MDSVAPFDDEIVGLCPTPRKLFEKSLTKNFDKIVLCTILGLCLVLFIY